MKPTEPFSSVVVLLIGFVAGGLAFWDQVSACACVESRQCVSLILSPSLLLLLLLMVWPGPLPLYSYRMFWSWKPS